MKRIISNAVFVAIAASSMLFSSCHDVDYFDPSTRLDDYKVNWKGQIGDIDPNQDWSMATTVTATVNVPEAGNNVLGIYTENPIHSSAKLLAKVFLNNGEGSASFDVVKGTDKVFMQVKNGNKTVVYGWADIINGTVDAGNATMERKSAKTRAANDVTIMDGAIYDIEALKFTPLSGGEQKTPDFKRLLNVERFAAKPWILSWGYELFGERGKSFFKEAVKYYDDSKTGIAGYDINKVEQPFTITTTKDESEISLPVIYSCTGGQNVLGYIYYKDGQDPLTQPHYLLINDAQPQSNIYFNKWYNSKNEAGNDVLGNWDTLGNWDDGNKSLSGRDPETEVYGTEYKLAFFGEDHNQTATYHFPKGYHVVFFIAPVYNVDEVNSEGKPNVHLKNEQFAYSDPELNRRIGHTRAWNAEVAKRWGQPYPEANDKGAVKATAWKYNDCTFLGFEDFFDDDLNDIVILVDGDFIPDTDIPEVPSTTKPNETIQSWIFACEDLGGTDDFDFNDIVIEVRTKVDEEKVYQGDVVKETKFKKAELQMRFLAAGGIYEANVYYGDNSEKHVGESHAMLGGAPGNMLNTTEPLGSFSNWITLASTTDKDEWDSTLKWDWIIENIQNQVKIVVSFNNKENSGTLIQAPTEGEYPQLMVMPGDWKWPTERTHIYDAYPGFKGWTQSSQIFDWVHNVVADKVINR